MQNTENVQAIQVEVLVPHFTLPVVSSSAEPSPAKRRADAEAHMPEVTIGPLHSDTEQPAAEELTGTVYTTRKGLFRLFRLQKLALRGPKLLALRIFQRWPQGAHASANLDPTHEMVFSIAYQGPTAEPETTIELLPGLNQVVITLDEDGLPQGYTIDGTEG